MWWRCKECGKPHRKNSPPCRECGGIVFEQAVVREESEQKSESSSLSRNIHWECTECGQQHVKNSPPCNQCGHMHFEAVETKRDDSTEISTSWLTGSKRYLAGIIVVFAVLGIVATGTVELPSTEKPTIANVPGDSNSSSGMNLTESERLLQREVNDARSSEGRPALGYDTELAEIAEYHAKDMVKNNYYGYTGPGGDTVRDRFGSFEYDCTRDPRAAINRIRYDSETSDRPIDHYSTEATLVTEIVDSWMDETPIRETLLDGRKTSIGADLHVDEKGDIYIVVTMC